MSFVTNPLSGMKVVLTHEIVEIITDPQPGPNTVAWYINK
jgi:hypothetical protein